MQENPRTLFLSYDGLTDPLGQSQVLPYLAGLAQAGFQVHLISFEKKERWESLGSKLSALCQHNNIQWHPLLYHKSPPVLSTLYDLYQMRKTAARLHQQYNFQLVHARSYPPALVALWLKNNYQIPYLFDIRGFWPEERVEGGIWNIKNPLFHTIYHYFKRKETELYKKAGAVVTLTHKAKEILLLRPDLKGMPAVSVIPCCADMDHFDPAKISDEETLRLRSSVQLNPTDFVLCYIGSIGTWYMLEEMLQFFTVLKEEEKKAKLLFVTRDPAEVVLAAARQAGVSASDVRVISVPYAEVPLCIAASQASVFFIRPSFSKQASSPTKQGELLAMGKPLVTNAGVGDSDKIILQTGGGVLIHDFSVPEYREAAKKLLHLSLDLQQVRSKAADIYSLKKGISQYQILYQKLCALQQKAASTLPDV